MQYELYFLETNGVTPRIHVLGPVCVGADTFLSAAEEHVRRLKKVPKGQLLLMRQFDDHRPPQIVAVECCSANQALPRGQFELTANDQAAE